MYDEALELELRDIAISVGFAGSDSIGHKRGVIYCDRLREGSLQIGSWASIGHPGNCRIRV